MSITDRYHQLPHPQQILVWLVLFVVLAGAGVYGFGWIKNTIEEHRYEKSKAADEKKAKDAEGLAQQALGVAKQKEVERDAALKDAKEAHDQLTQALQLLNDATKTTAQKRAALEAIRNQPNPVVAQPGASADDLCATARQLDIKSKACPQ